MTLIFEMDEKEEGDCSLYSIKTGSDKGGFEMKTIDGSNAWLIYDEIDAYLNGKEDDNEI